jgi:hypothetical protein
MNSIGGLVLNAYMVGIFESRCDGYGFDPFTIEIISQSFQCSWLLRNFLRRMHLGEWLGGNIFSR